MATKKHSSSEKNEKGQVVTVEWWTLSCDERGCSFTAQGQHFSSESAAQTALTIHEGMAHPGS